jgi:hypothetical protein
MKWKDDLKCREFNDLEGGSCDLFQGICLQEMWKKAVYCENHTKHTNTPCEQIAEF